MRRTAALVIAVLCLGLTVRSRADVSFQGIPAAHTVAEANQRLSRRIARVVEEYAGRRHGRFPRSPEERVRFGSTATAKLYRGVDVDAVNQELLRPRARPYAAYGTDIRVIPVLCERSGDYDFMAQDLVRLVYANLSFPEALWPKTVQRIARELLTARGGRHDTRFRLGVCGQHRETENHVWMTESSRYLTNQLLRRGGERDPRFDNRKNGFDRWLLRRLGRPLRKHFEEYNARPYQGYTVASLENLHAFAEDERVAESAGMVLDYLSAIFAVQSNGLRRFPPFRRQAQYLGQPLIDDHDTETARFALLAGNYHFHAADTSSRMYGGHFMLAAALSRYRVPGAILDLIVDKKKSRTFQTLHHDNVEVYASSESFLISGGGTFSRHFKYGSDEQHGWARPTVVLPTHSPETDVRRLLRIEGSKSPRTRNNTCVAPGFACGLNVRIPDTIPASCRVERGPFTFLNLTAEACPEALGFYAAVFRAPCVSAHCQAEGDNHGFFELREASELRFADFVATVTRENPARRFRSRGQLRYRTSTGHTVRFEAVPTSLERWPLVSIDGVRQSRAFARWPLARGDVLNARGDGLVTIDNRALGVRIELDLRDPLHPERREIVYDVRSRPLLTVAATAE